MSKRVNVVHIIGLLSIFTLIFGCKKGPTIIDFGEPTIFAELTRYRYYYDQPIRNQAEVVVYGSHLVPIVSINDDTLEFEYYSSSAAYVAQSYFLDYLYATPGDEFEMVVYHDEGEASATVTLPGDFALTPLQENDTLFLDEDFAISWGKSEGAERYFVRIYMRYYYIDTTGIRTYFYFDTSLYTIDTNFVVPLERMLLPQVDSVDYGYGYVTVNAENGAWIGHSLEGNITGDGIGYFTAYNQINGDVDFRIENSSVLVLPASFDPFDEIIKISPRKRFEKRLEYLLNHDLNFSPFAE